MTVLGQMLELAFVVFVKFGNRPYLGVLNGFPYSWADLMDAGLDLIVDEWKATLDDSYSRLQVTNKREDLEYQLLKLRESEMTIGDQLRRQQMVCLSPEISEDLFIPMVDFLKLQPLVFSFKNKEYSDPVIKVENDVRIGEDPKTMLLNTISLDAKNADRAYVEEYSLLERADRIIPIGDIVLCNQAEIEEFVSVDSPVVSMELVKTECVNLMMATVPDVHCYTRPCVQDNHYLDLHMIRTDTGKLKYLSTKWDELAKSRYVKEILIFNHHGQLLYRDFFADVTQTTDWLDWLFKVRRVVVRILSGCIIGGVNVSQHLKILGLMARDYFIYDISLLKQLKGNNSMPSLEVLGAKYKIGKSQLPDAHWKMRVMILLGARFFANWCYRRSTLNLNVVRELQIDFKHTIHLKKN